MPRLHIREAVPGDGALLAKLNVPVQRLHAKLYPERFKAQPEQGEVADFFEKIIAAERHHIAVCEAEEDTLGYVWIEEQSRPASPFTMHADTVYLHHIAVIEGARRMGVATAMMGWVEDRAREAGVASITLDHWAMNETAKAFFGRCGFEPQRVVLSRKFETK